VSSYLARRVVRIAEELAEQYGPQGWWPTTARAGWKPVYRPGKEGRRTTARESYEILVGAILTQNTAWKNVEKAIVNLTREDRLRPERIARAGAWLEEAIRPSGYFNQKAARLREVTRLLLSHGGFARLRRLSTPELRVLLLSWRGIGPETADSILCYAFQRPVFVVDAYTKRLFAARGLPHGSYDEMQALVHAAIPASAARYGDLHALIVANGKPRRSL